MSMEVDRGTHGSLQLSQSAASKARLHGVMRQTVSIRVLDVIFSALGLMSFAPVLAVLIVLSLVDTGSPIFRQTRIGRDQRPFTLFKIRTMKLRTAWVASHLVDRAAITRLGSILRKTKLDELPQLWNVLVGDMSIVGPRPGLLAQEELTRERALRGVYSVRPGITGLAQLSGIDMSTPRLLAETDRRMIDGLNVGAYLKYIVLTAFGKGSGDCVR